MLDQILNMSLIPSTLYYFCVRWCYISSFTLLYFAKLLLQMTLHVLICRFSLKFSYFGGNVNYISKSCDMGIFCLGPQSHMPALDLSPSVPPPPPPPPPKKKKKLSLRFQGLRWYNQDEILQLPIKLYLFYFIS